MHPTGIAASKPSRGKPSIMDVWMLHARTFRRTVRYRPRADSSRLPSYLSRPTTVRAFGRCEPA
jgi:hypothetical protein